MILVKHVSVGRFKAMELNNLSPHRLKQLNGEDEGGSGMGKPPPES